MGVYGLELLLEELPEEKLPELLLLLLEKLPLELLEAELVGALSEEEFFPVIAFSFEPETESAVTSGMFGAA